MPILPSIPADPPFPPKTIMPATAQESYLVAEVMTATPQKLRLMLLDAAIRSAERARGLADENEWKSAVEKIIHVQNIVSELLSSLDYESGDELVKKVASIYLFIFRTLVIAAMKHDAEKLDEAIRVLEVERETWRQVCDKFGGRIGAASNETPNFAYSEDAVASAVASIGAPISNDYDMPVGGFSIEA